MVQAGVSDIPVFGLAKRYEWLYAPDSPDPIILDRDSPALKLVQQIRDEAHRFAITFHRQLRTGRNLRSLLDGVPGIGPKRKRLLLRRYATLEELASAPTEEVAALPGMTIKAAESVQAYLRAGMETRPAAPKGAD
jgi:excinuclease ABC subunit C